MKDDSTDIHVNKRRSDPLPNPESVGTLIRTRRSIKPGQFDGRRIDDVIVREMLENANWAPTHGMTEPWRFFVFCDEVLNSLGRKLAEIYRRVTPSGAFKPAKAEKLLQSAIRSSHVIAFAMKRQESRRIPEIEEIQAVACAIQNLHLTATAYGVGGSWSSGKVICSDQFRDSLGLDVEDRVLGLFYLGFPAVPWPAGERSPIAEKVQWFRAAEGV